MVRAHCSTVFVFTQPKAKHRQEFWQDEADRAYEEYKKYANKDSGVNPFVLRTGFTEIESLRCRHGKVYGYRCRINHKSKPVYFFKSNNPFWEEDCSVIRRMPKEIWKITLLPLGRLEYQQYPYLFAIRVQPASAITQLDMLLERGGSGRPNVSYKFLKQLQKEIRAMEDEMSDLEDTLRHRLENGSEDDLVDQFNSVDMKS